VRRGTAWWELARDPNVTAGWFLVICPSV